MERPLSPFAAGSSTIYSSPIGQDPDFANLELMTGHVPLEPSGSCDAGMMPGSTVMGESEGMDVGSGRLAAPLGSRGIFHDSKGTEALREGVSKFLGEEEHEREHGGTDEHVGFKKLEGELSHEKGVRDPAAVAAKIGVEKYGKKGMAAKAHGG